MTVSKLSLLAGVGMLALGLAAPAGAVTITTSGQFGPGPTDYNGAGIGATTLNTFDSTLGTLNSVAITVTYGFNSSITVSNSAQANSSGTVRTESASGFRSTTSAIDNVLQSMVDQVGAVTVGGTTVNPAAFDVLGRTQSYSLAPGQSQQLTSVGATQNYGTGALTDSTTLSAFSTVGASTFVAQLLSGTGTLLSNTGGNTSAQQTTTATGTIQVVYDYTAAVVPPTTVPEPASLALLGAGLLGLGMVRRKSA